MVKFLTVTSGSIEITINCSQIHSIQRVPSEIGDGDRAKIFILNRQSIVTRQSYDWVLGKLREPMWVRLVEGTSTSNK